MGMASTESLIRDHAGSAPGIPAASSGTLLRESDTRWRWLRPVFSLAAAAVGVWLCIRFCSALEWHLIAKDLQHVGTGALLLFLAPVVGNFVHMLGWRALLSDALRPGLWRCFAIFLAAQAGNEIGLGVLGESVKVSELSSAHRPLAIRAVVLDNLSALLALGAVMGSIALFLGGAHVPHGFVLGTLVLLAVSATVGLTLSKRGTWSSATARGIGTAFVAHYLGKLWIVAEFALVLALLGHVTLRSSAVLGLVSTVASAVGTAIPGQLGVLEAALKGSAASAAVAASTLVSIALLRRARSVGWVLLGALLFWRLRAQSAGARFEQA